MNDEDSGTSLPQDLLGGILAVAFGLFAFVTASSYPMGSLLRMGPGFFPCTIAALIMLLGLALIGSGFRSRTNVDIRLRSVLMIGLGIVIFALLLERAGLVPATLALVLVSSVADPQWRPRRAAILAAAMTALVYVIFVVLLRTAVPAVNL
jgi:hypothetical protein